MALTPHNYILFHDRFWWSKNFTDGLEKLVYYPNTTTRSRSTRRRPSWMLTQETITRDSAQFGVRKQQRSLKSPIVSIPHSFPFNFEWLKLSLLFVSRVLHGLHNVLTPDFTPNELLSLP